MASEAIVARLKAVLSGDSSQLRADLGKAERSLKTFGDNATKVGRSLTTKVTLPMVGLGAAAVKTAVNFETSMTKITALVGVAKDEVDTMSVAVRGMATQFGKSANEAADALFYITSAGLRGATATDTLAASLKASAIGLGDTATIADLATSALNAYGADVLSATQATDVMTATIREGKLETTELAGSMGRVLPLASAMGVNFNEVGAAFAALSRTGTNAAEAATQIRGILASLLRPTKQAEEALTEMGLSSEGLRRQMREEGLLATLKTLSEEFAGNEAAAASVFGNIRALSGVLDLMGANVATTEQIFASMTDTTGAVDEAFAQVSQTAAFQFQQAMAEMKETLLVLGQDLLPLVKDAVGILSESIRGVTGFFQEMDSDTQHAVKALAGVVAIAGPVALGVGMISKALLALKAANPWILGITTALTGLGYILGRNMAEARAARERQEELTQAFVDAGDPTYTLESRLEGLASQMKAIKEEATDTAPAVEAFVGEAMMTAALASREALDDFNKLSEGISGLDPIIQNGYHRFGEMASALSAPDMEAGLDTLLRIAGTKGPLRELADQVLANVRSFEDGSDAQQDYLNDMISMFVGLDETSKAFKDARLAIEANNLELITSGRVMELFGDKLGADLVNSLIEGVTNTREAARALEELERVAMLTARAQEEAAWWTYELADSQNALSVGATYAGFDVNRLAGDLVEAGNMAGYDAYKTKELIEQLGILDQLDPEVIVDLGLDITGAAQVIRFIDDLIESQRAALMSMGDGRFITRALEPLFNLRAALQRTLDEPSDKETGGRGSAASNAISEIDRAAEEAAREAERLQREIERLIERVEDMGKVVGDEDFFEFLLGASADQIEDRFEDIAEAAMELVEQANELNVPGGPEFLQALGAIGEQFDALAAIQSRVASTQEEIVDVEGRLASATNELASAQAHLNDLNAQYLGTRTPAQQLADATNALAAAQSNLNRENDRYAAFLYGEGAGGGTFEDALRAEIDIYRNLQRELSGVESAQAGFRQNIIDMMSPTVAGAAGAGGVMGNLGNILAQARTFRNNLIELRDRGFPTDVIGQVVAAGMTNGNVISRRLLALGTAEFEEFLALREQIGRIGVETAAIAGEVIFGADIADAQGAVREQFAIVDRMFQSAIAEAEASQQAQQAIVDAMFRNAIAEAEAAVRTQEETVERLRATLGTLQDRLLSLQDQVAVLAGGIQSALTAAFDQFLTGFNNAITRIAQVADVPAPPPAPAPAQVSRPASAPERVVTPTPIPAPAPAPAPLAPIGVRYPERQVAPPTPQLAYRSLRGGGGGGPLRMMARGGRVSGGHPYLVGEMGPELFIPGESGGILSNRATSQVGTGVVNYNISVTANGDPAEAGRQIVKAIQEYERRNGNRWRSS
jgi:TP901 family phage tail tape measure protein